MISITKDQIKTSTKEVLAFIPVVENPIGRIMTNKDYWVAVEGIYEAQGGEKFLTIGNFNNNYVFYQKKTNRSIL